MFRAVQFYDDPTNDRGSGSEGRLMVGSHRPNAPAIGTFSHESDGPMLW